MAATRSQWGNHSDSSCLKTGRRTGRREWVHTRLPRGVQQSKTTLYIHVPVLEEQVSSPLFYFHISPYCHTCAEVNFCVVNDPVLLVAELKLGVCVLYSALHSAIIELLVASLCEQWRDMNNQL